jgi:hypothetical protein
MTERFRSMNRCRFLLTLLACLVFSPVASAQTDQPQTATHVTLGRSVVPLYGPWKFTLGDSPIDPATHAPLWAAPGFDDSQWETVDLTPEGLRDPLGGYANYVKGWTARGHAGHWGYAWYRIRVQVLGVPGEQLALAGPEDVDDAYQLFDDGKLVGSFGKFAGGRPSFYFTQPMMFNLPQASANVGTAGPPLVIAFRFWMSPSTVVLQPDVGGIHTAPLLGNAETVSARYQLNWLQLVRAQIFVGLVGLLFLLVAIGAFSLTRLDRSDPVYTWMGAVFLLLCLTSVVNLLSGWSQYLDAMVSTVMTDAILWPLVFGGWIMVWWVWFRLQRPTWIPKAIGLLTLGFMLTTVIGENLLYPMISPGMAGFFQIASIGVRLALLALLVLVIFWAIRRQGVEGWLVLPAMVLFVLAQFTSELSVMHFRINWFLFGVRISMGQIADLLLTAVLFVLLLRRLLFSIKQQRLLALDVKQAQEVQRVILPEDIPSVPGLTIENEYRPAREVGGDFFQILPNAADGSLLIVAGDVAGKGLQAGMLVALLVGAIRSTCEMNADPLFVLRALNRRLLGRGEAQATCLAMRITADGAVTLANAGHLPPYLNGQPLEVEGALPLGVIEDAGSTVTHFQLQENDRLVLASDGIVEAMDEQGQLFGFTRVQELLQARLSASELAATAQSFGQRDDISVIAVTRTASLVPA